ncbi:MAG: cation-translocating P-type ATPase [Desulfuromonadales bacterium]
MPGLPGRFPDHCRGGAGPLLQNPRLAGEIPLFIDGIRCASCIWLLEKLLQRQPGIQTVRINYGTHRARIQFSPAQTSPYRIFATISQLGYLPHPFHPGVAEKSAAEEQRSLLIRFGTAAFLSMQLMAFSFALYAGYFHGIAPQMRQLLQAFAAVVATPVVFYSGWPFLAGAWRSLRNRSASMDLLIALGVITAYGYSLVMLFQGGEIYFDTAAMIITLILLGRLFESAARKRSIAGIDRLLQLAPNTAHRLVGDRLETIASSRLVPGDLILVRPGERIPVDGRILEGATEIDESMISGEPLPVLRQPRDRVAAGCLNITTAVRLQVERIAAESFIARMARLVEEAQARKAPIQSLADRVATIFIPLVSLVALGTWIFWAVVSTSQATAILNAISVLIVACPCALGLATPTAVLAASGSAAGRGILFRGGDILEATARIDLIAFDKTGTLTQGHPEIAAIVTAPQQSEKGLLTIAASVEQGSTHPLARAVLKEARRHGVQPIAPPAVTTLPGRGLRAEISNGTILVGSRALLNEAGVAIPPAAASPSTEVHISCAGQWQGTLLIRDPLRADATGTLSKLHALGLQTVLLTGDRAETAGAVSAALTIAEYHAEMSPMEKSRWIGDRQQAGHKIMMVGDGINDAPALSLADVGCAMAGGTDIALETSELVLTRPRLSRLYDALVIARKTLTIIRQNLFWAFTYNLITIPLAASGHLAPVWAAAAMATSSVLVVGNSLRLGHQVRRSFSVVT